MWRGFDAELVVASADVLDEGVTSDHYRGGPVAFESAHWSKPGFESAVITLEPVVGELLGVVKRVRNQLLDDRLQRRADRAVPLRSAWE